MHAIAVALLALSQVANSAADILLDPGTVQGFITFEAVNSTDFAANNALLALDGSSDQKIACNAGPLYSVVRMSSCFTAKEMKKIDTWVQTKLAVESATMYSDGETIAVNYYAELDSSGCANPSAWADVTSPYMKTTADMPNGALPSAVFSIAKGDTLFHTTSALMFPLRVSSSTSYKPITGEKLFNTVNDLVAGGVKSKTRRIPCASISGVAVPFNDNTGKAQCMCKCTNSYKLSGGSCVLKVVNPPSCTWHFGDGKCLWSSADKSAMSFVDCGADLLIPKDNYVNDGRFNKHDYDAIPSKPMINIMMDSTTSTATPWKKYVKEPEITLSSISFPTFNVYHPTMTASDYGREASCTGCVAVVDNFLPDFINPYTQDVLPTKDPTNPTLLSQESLQAAMVAEAAFIDTYAATNIINNAGDTDRTLDIKEDTIVDFFETTEKKLADTEYTACFSDNIVSQMLSKSLLVDPDAVSVTNAKRMRCCSRKITLVEAFYDYACGTNETPDKETRSGGSISFSHCMYIEASTLFTASAGIKSTEDNPSTIVMAEETSQETVTSIGTRGYVHRTSPCIDELSGENCALSETLSKLFELSASWKDNAPGGVNHGSDSVDKFVFWRYKVGVAEWKVWSTTAEATFDASNTAVYLEAWTQFGKVGDTFKFEYVLHAKKETATCSEFSSMWSKLTTNSLTHETNFCAYPSSDFVPLLFYFSGEIETTKAAGNPSLKSVECKLKLSNTREKLSVSGSAAMFSQAIVQHQPMARYFGVDLVNSPTTEAITYMEIQCSFLHSTGDGNGFSKSCNKRFEVMDCSSPDISSTRDVCSNGQCTEDAPGPGESCGGKIFVYLDGEGTKMKQSTVPACCDSCSTPLACTPILDISDMVSGDLISRCEPNPNAAVNGGGVTLLAEEKLVGSVHSPAVEASLIGASALVAVVVLVLAKSRVVATQEIKTLESDTHCYSLLG